MKIIWIIMIISTDLGKISTCNVRPARRMRTGGIFAWPDRLWLMVNGALTWLSSCMHASTLPTVSPSASSDGTSILGLQTPSCREPWAGLPSLIRTRKASHCSPQQKANVRSLNIILCKSNSKQCNSVVVPVSCWKRSSE